MATIYNSDLTNELVKGAKIQVNRDNVPNRLADSVVPTLEVNPDLLRKSNFIKSVARSTTGILTLTSEASKDTYITGAWLSLVKNVLNDTASALYSITIIQDGLGKPIVGINALTLTASDQTVTITFANPIKIDRGTSATTNTLTVGAGAALLSMGLNGYTVDNPNA